jgi:hypothetical protein
MEYALQPSRLCNPRIDKAGAAGALFHAGTNLLSLKLLAASSGAK